MMDEKKHGCKFISKGSTNCLIAKFTIISYVRLYRVQTIVFNAATMFNKINIMINKS